MITYKELRERGSNYRVHGNGFIQIDLDAGERVHIFGHPLVPRQKRPSPIHDHRFSFESTILSGMLVNVRWVLGTVYYTGHTHRVHTLEASGRGVEDTVLVPTEITGKLFSTGQQVLLPGDTYTTIAGDLHETLANEPTITHMRKLGSHEISTRVLLRLGVRPDNSFSRYAIMDDSLMHHVIHDTFERAGLAV